MQLSAIDLNLLVVLDALLQERSVARAARRVGLSASAMSHALARLRAVLDDPILVRSGREMVPSPRAEALTERVRRAVIEAEKVFAPSRGFEPGDLRKPLRVGASDIATVVLGPALEQLLVTEAPGVVLHYAPFESFVTRLRDGTYDLALGPLYDLPADVLGQPLFEDTWVCVVRAESPIPDRPRVDQLAELEFVDLPPWCGRTLPLDQAFARNGHPRKVARTVPGELAALHLVARTSFATLVPSSIARVLQRHLRLRVIPLPVAADPVVVGFAWHLRTNGDVEQVWLRELVERAADLSV